MRTALQIIALVLVAASLTPPLAHTLELPGKLRLSRQEYLVVQPIYYPGFTWAGIVEPAAILGLATLVSVTDAGGAPFWLMLGALLSLVLMHGLYWLKTHPVNNFWLRDTDLPEASKRFFGLRNPGAVGPETADWTALRYRWEYSHVARACLAFLALVLLAAGVALD